MTTRNNDAAKAAEGRRSASETRYPLLRARLLRLVPELASQPMTEEAEQQALTLLLGSLLPQGGGQ